MRQVFLAAALTICASGIPALAEVPDGFVLQRLEETDGSILRPRDWHFSSSGRQSGWTWTVSKEMSDDGFYETGFRIQLLVGVAAGTGKSREEFVQGFLVAKQDSAEVLSTCETQDAGAFLRRCLEVLEERSSEGKPTQFRVLYSMLWGKEIDLVAVTTFGSPPEEWESLRETSRIMSEFTLIGPNFGK